jgi:tetratricopeptide (TPR) repeat protein
MTRPDDHRARRGDDVLEKNVETLLGGSYDPPRLGDGARARIREALVARAADRQPAPRPRRRLVYGAALAGAIAAAAGATLVVRAVGGGGASAERDGQEVTLADGSTAILDRDATLDALGDRRVRIHGRALVDVVPGKGRFVVETANGRLEVLGTRFVVDADDARTQAAVIRGKVRISTDDGDAVLHAGELGTAVRGQPPRREPAPRLSHLASWAALQRRKDEGAPVGPVRNGTLFARTTGRPAHAPFVSPDEFPLPLTDLTVDAVVDNQVARVALDQTFHNPEPQDLEGVYRFALPADAALSRLAMYVDGHLEEAAVVERMRARRVYEDLVYHQIDPALLEWTGAGKVQLRVYPLPANGDKRIVLAYTQSLPRLYDDYTLTVPLPELDHTVGHVHLKVRVKDCARCTIHSPSHDVQVAADGADAVVTFDRQAERLGDSLVLDVRNPDKKDTVAVETDGDWRYLLARSQPPIATPGAAPPEHRARRWVLLDDVSASRDKLELKAQADVVDHLLTELDEDDQVAVLSFDVGVRDAGPMAKVVDVDRHQVRQALERERGGVGATDLDAALTRALALLGDGDPRDRYVVYLGDGEVTDGERTLGTLRARLRGKATFVGVGIGDGADLPTLATLADATGGMTYTIDPADDLGWRAFDLVAALYTPRATGLDVDVLGPDGTKVPGALAYLRSGELGAGEQLEVVARVPARARVAAIAVHGDAGGAPWSVRIDPAAAARPAGDPGYLPRMWAKRRIAALLRDKLDDVPCAGEPCPSPEELLEAHREVLRKEIVALGKRYFILSRHTSLLVLENDAMYAQYGVPRTRTAQWAPYQVPATIPVAPRGTGPAPIAAGTTQAVLVREPQPVFYRQDQQAMLESTWWNGPAAQPRGGGFAGPVRRDWVVTRGLRAQDGLDRMGWDLDANRETTIEAEQTKKAKGESAPMASATGDTASARVTTLPDADSAALDQTVVTTAGLDVGGYGTIGHGAGGGGTGFGYGRGHATRWAGEGLLGKNADEKLGGLGYGPMQAGQLAPVSMVSPSDPRLDDLTDQVTGFFPGPFDAAAADLHRAGHGKHGSIDPAARALLDAARRQVRPGAYRWGDGPEVTVDGAGRLGWRMRDDDGLDELDSYDGTTWRRAYPELGLELVRPVGDDEPALYGTVLPVLVASPDHLARWYDVTAAGRTVTLKPATGAGTPITIDLDGQGRVVALRAGGDDVTITWGAAGPTAAQLGATSIAVSFSPAADADATAQVRADAGALVAVDLPLHTPAYWRTRLATMTAGSDPWRHGERQLLAALAALRDHAGLWTEYQALRAHGGIAAGDVALASRGLAIATTDDQLTDALAHVPDGARAMAGYLAAARRYGKHPGAGVFAPVAGDGLIGTLARYREVLARITAGKIDGAVDALEAMGDRAPTLRLIAASTLSSRYMYQRTHADEIARVWDAVAKGPWRNVARYEAARALYYRGDYAGAADRFAALLGDVDLDAAPVPWDGIATYAMQQSPRGQVGWQLAWAAWKGRVLADGDLGHVLALARAAASASPGDLDRVLGRAADLAAGDSDATAQVAGMALTYGQLDRAAALVDDARKLAPSPFLDRLAAQIAERQGRPAAAAALLSKALAAATGPTSLSQVRADYGHLIQLEGRVAALATGADRDHAVANLLDDAAAWRDIDPDDDGREQAVAQQLLAAGRHAEAMRVLSTVIERHPMEGTGWAMMAESLEREGRLAEARDYWHQAVVIDQTNPQWRLRDAQVLLALGRGDDARAELAEITHRHWHARWGMVVDQVRGMLARLDAERAKAGKGHAARPTP